MIPVQPANDESNPPLAIGGGILVGLATLAVIGGIFWAAGRSGENTDDAAAPVSRIGSLVTKADLRTGDCFDFTTGGGSLRQFRIADCDTSHLAQVSGQIDHPDAGGSYPGDDAMKIWFTDRCVTMTEGFVDATILETTLDAGVVLPNADDWAEGDSSTSCYVRRLMSEAFTSSAEGRGDSYPRGVEVVVSRLIDGDCFVPTDGTDSYDLNSNSPVIVVSCEENHNGVFFGRAMLDFPVGAEFPGEDQVGVVTGRRCGELFSDHFGKDSEGFNYRYWRPNRQSWDLNDRMVLCAVLDANTLTERFDPAIYERFFDLATGQCFNLGPEEESDSLRLDDQVRMVTCTEAHIGQMIGSGELGLEAAAPFPVGDEILELAGGECEQLFVDFVGTSPYDSEYGNFPFWYPNEPGWNDGDRRYACAFLEDNPRFESLENIGA